LCVKAILSLFQLVDQPGDDVKSALPEEGAVDVDSRLAGLKGCFEGSHNWSGVLVVEEVTHAFQAHMACPR
jgi:hypothetical protein